MPQRLDVFVPVYEPEPETTEPEAVAEALPVYVPAYTPVRSRSGGTRSIQRE